MKSTARMPLLDYPQSGRAEFADGANIQESRFVQPDKKRFTVPAELSAAAISWVTEFVLTYDGTPSYTVSIMEISRRTGGPTKRNISPIGFDPASSRAHLV